MIQNIFREYDIRRIYQKELNEQTVKKRFIYSKYISLGYDARTHLAQLALMEY